MVFYTKHKYSKEHLQIVCAFQNQVIRCLPACMKYGLKQKLITETGSTYNSLCRLLSNTIRRNVGE